MLNADISDLTITTDTDPIMINHSEQSVGAYLQLGFSPKDGGVLGLIKYNVSEQMISLQIGWNFGSSTKSYNIAKETSF